MNEQATNGAGEAPQATPAKVIEVIEFKDGRKVEFAGKRKMIKDSIFKEDGTLDFVRLDFRNGESLTFTPIDALVWKFVGHGAEQKLGDEVAGLEDVDDMVLAVGELIDRLGKGEWSTRREGSGLGGTSVLLRALMEQSGKDIETVKAFLKLRSPAEKTALRGSKTLKPIVERLEAEKLSKAAKVDTDSLLAAL